MLGLVMIVKDGAETIEACLRSAMEAGVTVATVVDTGSTDGTPEIVRRVCQDIELRLYEREFRDFGTDRSEAFRLARGTADWLLASDADFLWTVEDFRPDPDVAAYTVDMGNGQYVNRLPLVLRGDLPWVSIGPVHEYTALADGTLGRRESTDAIRVRQPGARAWTPEKARWHLTLLDDSPRSRFYRAKTLDELGDPGARDAWEGVGVSAEERYYAMWRRALLAPDWATRQTDLQAAWEYRPARLEALYDLCAGLNDRGMHHVAWALSSVVTPPCSDETFVERWVWDWGLLFQRQIAAWWVGAPEFTPITDRLLSLELPDHIRCAVERNASLRAA